MIRLRCIFWWTFQMKGCHEGTPDRQVCPPPCASEHVPWYYEHEYDNTCDDNGVDKHGVSGMYVFGGKERNELILCPNLSRNVVRLMSLLHLILTVPLWPSWWYLGPFTFHSGQGRCSHEVTACWNEIWCVNTVYTIGSLVGSKN